MEHKQDCPWWKDWHECNCGVYDGCHLVIPGTFIACGEMGQYCSEKCLKKATGKV